MKEKRYDLYVIICLIIFFIISLSSIYSAMAITSESMGNILLKQIVFYAIGTIALLFAYKYKEMIGKYYFLWYIGFNILLLFLLIFGISVNGSKCWIFIGPFSLQPSEFMKISLIIIIANILSKYEFKKNKSLKSEVKLLITILVITLIPSILTFLEPDTGVVIIYLVIMISMIAYKGINKKWYIISLIIIIILISSFLALFFLNNDILIKILGENIFYRMERVLNWSNQSGYQLQNSLIAIGSSGLTGFGFNKIPIYFPEASTDFIFSTFVSNFGFMGALLLIVTIVILDIGIISLSTKKIEIRDKYFLIGVSAMILYQQIQNIGMTIGLLPITGITLPFISYGGSSLLSYMFICGIILKIISERRKYLN